MRNKDIIDAVRGYVVGNAFSKALISNLDKELEEIRRKKGNTTSVEVLSAEVAKFLLAENKQGAFEYLNEQLTKDLISLAQNQRVLTCPLDTMIKQQYSKYLPIYKRVGMDIPDNLRSVTADSLCKMLGVQNLHIADRQGGNTKPTTQDDEFGFWFWVRAILIIGMVTLLIIVNL